MWIDVKKIRDDHFYTVKEIAKFIGKTELTVRKYVSELPEEFRMDLNKKGKFRKYLVSGEGIKYILGM